MKHIQSDNTVIEFPITNDIIFNLVMRDPSLCRQLLERVFPEKKIGEIRLSGDQGKNSSLSNIKNPLFINTQQVFENGISSKGVRLDVFMINENEWFDIELQCQQLHDLPKRSRYYHSTMDVTMLHKGEGYNNLKTSYVIFICTFDPFKENLPVYRFQNMCTQKSDLQLDDGTCTIFLNATCTDESVPEELGKLFRYICKMECCEDDPFITRLHERVKELNTAEGRKILRTLEDKINEEKALSYETGFSEGEVKGERKGVISEKKSTALAMLNEGLEISLISRITGLSPEEIKKLK